MNSRFFSYVNKIENGSILFEKLINLSLLEDLGRSNSCLTTDHLSGKDTLVKGNLLIKSPGIICGIDIFDRIFSNSNDLFKSEYFYQDGDRISKTPCLVGRIETTAQNFLKHERLALNLIQHLSSIATQTKKMVDYVSGYDIDILDTRKTIPGLRLFEKYAVYTGGGKNHRMGLYDKVLIKDNHIKLANGIESALDNFGDFAQVQIEIASLAELDKLIKLNSPNVKAVLLDNMSPIDIIKAVHLCQGKFYIEVSGGINSKNLKDYLIFGVNAISMGSLTHSIDCLDYSLKLEL